MFPQFQHLFMRKKGGYKMNRYYYSIYGALIKQFIESKRILGINMQWLNKNVPGLISMHMITTKKLLVYLKNWQFNGAQKRPNESVKTRRNRVQIIRAFSAYLCCIGYPSHVPQIPRAKSMFIPYIFSKDEVEKIFVASNFLRPAENNPNSAVFAIPCLFRLLYGTGIRINEALHLLCKDVNLKDNHIVLRDNKNGRDRIVPISDSLAIVCEEYLKHSEQISHQLQFGALFYKTKWKAFR